MNAARPALLFDLDGTLIDSIDLIRKSYAHTLAEHFGRPHDEAEFLAGLGRPLLWTFRRWTDDPQRIEALLTTYRRFNFEHHDRSVRAFPGLPQVLAELAGAGRGLGLVTSKQRAGALRGLGLCGFEAGWFRALVGADDVQNHKPHPEPVERAAALLGLAPRDTIMIGDSPHDLASGRAAGARTAAVAWGPFPPDELRAERPDFWLETAADLARL
jgi:pyrophosphatase PpaX